MLIRSFRMPRSTSCNGSSTKQKLRGDSMNRLMESVATQTAFLVDASLKSVVVLVMAGALILLCRRASAAARLSIWFAAVATLLFLPMFSLIVPAWHKTLLVGFRPGSARNEG